MTRGPDTTPRPRHVPLSTYRLQVHGGFTLAEAQAITPYLARLGVDAVYTSPYFAAGAGSTHGYDVSDHNRISQEVGGEEALRAFSAVVHGHGLIHIVDFVPNHMGIGTGGNARWNDVLENGPSSPAAAFFDIDWAPVTESLQAKLLLPILGDQYGRVLERGELQLAFGNGHLLLRYFETELPINPRQAPRVYRMAIPALTASLGDDNAALHEFQSIITSLQNLPPYTEERAELKLERVRETDVARNRLQRLIADTPVIGEAIEAAVRGFNGEAGRPESFDALHELLEAQPYRLAYWRTASHQINYRRFFDVNTLAGIRVERQDVFDDVHRLLRTLISDGIVDGVRVDHPDGLFDPARYFEMLQDLAAVAWGVERLPEASGRAARPLYILAEKILSAHEPLPLWAIHGTTGYNYLNDANGVFVQTAHSRPLRRAYEKLTGRTDAFEDVLYESKRLIMETGMASELNVLAHMLHRIGQSSRRSRDFTLESLRDVMSEVIACFPVYRTYVDESGWTASDRSTVERAIVLARRRNPAMEITLFDFFREVVLPREVAVAGAADDRREGYPPADAEEVQQRLAFAMKFQQYTGPVQAKGLEDTSFYRYNLLLSLNDVGGDPSRAGRSVDEFHEASQRRLSTWPLEMLATSTHDTKLGEDTRARINVLSEIPDAWAHEAARWTRMNRPRRTLVDGELAPDRNDEYRFYQALTGAWPPDRSDGPAPMDLVGRLTAYMVKSVKEAKLHTSWLTPNDAYEQAVTAFVTGALADERFLADRREFQARVARAGAVNGLAQVALKIASPGIPDFYQGCELWDLSLVDPDNRRPIDFFKRQQLLDEVEAVQALEPALRKAAVAGLVRDWPDGRIKLLLTSCGLRLRREWPEVFLSGEYVPLETDTSVPAGLIAFARTHGRRVVIAVAPRFVAELVTAAEPMPVGRAKWKTSRVLLPELLAGRVFRHELTGAEVRPVRTPDEAWLFAGQVFDTVPVALLRTIDD